MDLVEAEDHYVLKADLPGVSEEDVAIEVENGVLTPPASARPSTSEASAASTASSVRSGASSAS